MTTTNTRANDARLHELLFGVACEMRYCIENDCEGWVEMQSGYEEGIYGEETYWRKALPELIAKQPHNMQPCWLQQVNKYGRWWVVPIYHDDPAAIRDAEAALPVELREDYACEIINEIVDREDLRGIAPYPARDAHEIALAYRGIYALITATPAQRAAALVSVLERVKEAK